MNFNKGKALAIALFLSIGIMPCGTLANTGQKLLAHGHYGGHGHYEHSRYGQERGYYNAERGHQGRYRDHDRHGYDNHYRHGYDNNDRRNYDNYDNRGYGRRGDGRQNYRERDFERPRGERAGRPRQRSEDWQGQAPREPGRGPGGMSPDGQNFGGPGQRLPGRHDMGGYGSRPFPPDGSHPGAR